MTMTCPPRTPKCLSPDPEQKSQWSRRVIRVVVKVIEIDRALESSLLQKYMLAVPA